MNLTALVALVLFLIQTPSARIEGRVVDSDSGQPLGASEVTLWRFSSGQQITTALTDPQGRFAFPDIAASDYRVSVRKGGYAENGPFVPSGATVPLGTPVIFQPNETVRSLEIRLSRESLITGRVLTSSGEPLADVEVQLISESYDATGRRLYGLTSASKTDDRGDYRLSGVFAGQYYLRAGVSEIVRSTGQIGLESSPAASYVTTFYPSADSVLQATRLDLRTPIERTSIDIVLKRRPTTKYRISGQLLDGRPVASRRGNIQYTFTPKNADGRAVTRVYSPEGDGTFEIADVDPGEYILTAQVQDPVARPTAPGTAFPGFHTLYASVPIHIVSSDIPNVRVTIEPVSLKGRLRMEDGTAPKDGLQVRLRKHDGNSPVPASVGVDGSFTFEDLGIGNEYALSVSGLEPDMYLKDARLNTVDLRYQLLPVTSASPLLVEILVGTRGGRIEGTTPKGGAVVAIIPAERYRTDLYKSAVADGQGRFSVRGIPPGEYKVFAWEKLTQRYLFFDPAFLGQFESAGKDITISEGSSETLQLSLIPQ